ncbi:hypothetical protein SUDANB108_00344 [Streptomyces sp. enrichment culture]|uniref:hypothetical protein n=1 Tax=Streptomyces sp. enrichment culture TaxID=1795815 RepID=UPI003F54B9CB
MSPGVPRDKGRVAGAPVRRRPSARTRSPARPSWKAFALLLPVSAAVAFAFGAVLDALALRRLRRRAGPRPDVVAGAAPARRGVRRPPPDAGGHRPAKTRAVLLGH